MQKKLKELPQGFRYRNDGRTIEYRFMTERGRKSVSGLTVKECREKELEYRKKVAENLKIESKNLTFADYLEEWIASRPEVSQSTIYSYKKKSKRLVELIGNIKLVDLERRDVVALQKALREHLSTSTVNYYITLTRSVLAEAVADRIISYNPAEGVKALKRVEPLARQTNHRALTLQEQEAFFFEASGTWYYELFCFLVLTGVRSGEAGALTWADIDKDVIHITKTVTRTREKTYELGKTKTSAGTRDIPLTDSIRKVLQAQKKKRLDHHGIDGVRPDAMVFTTLFRREPYVTATTITHAIDVILKNLKESGKSIEHFSAHAFRDTFATRCIEQGMQPNTLKALLGHTKIAMTMDLYAQVTEVNKADSLKVIQICV